MCIFLSGWGLAVNLFLPYCIFKGESQMIQFLNFVNESNLSSPLILNLNQFRFWLQIWRYIQLLSFFPALAERGIRFRAFVQCRDLGFALWTRVQIWLSAMGHSESQLQIWFESDSMCISEQWICIQVHIAQCLHACGHVSMCTWPCTQITPAMYPYACGRYIHVHLA